MTVVPVPKLCKRPRCLWVLVFLLSGVKCLKNVVVSVPTAVKTFDTVTLKCQFDLEGEPLYTVKWYKGQMEFFRYVPKELPNTQVFPVPGINVDLSRSSANEVVLQNVQTEVTGRFKCEVSTDAPNFFTHITSGFMYVVEIPEENPIMHVEKETLSYGYILRANCSTPPSFPAMNVTWYINGLKINEVVRKKINLDPASTSKSRRSPYMTVSYIEKEIDENLFQSDGVARLNCIGTLFNLYRGEDVKYIEEGKSRPWPSSVIGTFGETSDSTMATAYRGSLTFLLGFFVLR